MRMVVALILLLSMAAPARAADTLIGVVLPGTVLTFWQTLIKGVERAAQDLHVDVVVRSPSDGPLGAEPNIQLKIIDYLVHRGVAGIVLAPEQLFGVESPVSTAVPIVTVDRDSSDFVSLSTVETDNFAAGRLAASSLATVLPAQARVALLRHDAAITSTSQREAGFLSVAREQGWQVVVDRYVGYRYRYREAQDQVAAALASYHGRLDAVFAPSEPVAYGALRVIAGIPAADRPRLVVFDWRPELADALNSGLLYATVVQDPFRMGYRALGSLVAALQGRALPPRQYIDVVTVTRQSLTDPEIRRVLASYAD